MQYLFRCRWADNFICAKCGSVREPWLVETRRLIECPQCGRQVFLTAGTVMEGTRTPLRVWFYAAFLVTTHTPGFSALQFQRELGIKRYETAFNMLHKLRAAMVRPGRDRIHGVVEVDESYVGAPKPGKRGRGAAGKSIVAGALEIVAKTKTSKRVGRLRLTVVPNVQSCTLGPFVRQNVEVGSVIQTDDWEGYDKLSKFGYVHEVVPSTDLAHIHHTFGNLKTWLAGTHHGVSRKHLQAYVNEFTFRHNRRRKPMAAFQTILGLCSHAHAPTYKSLYAVGDRAGWTHPGQLQKGT